MAIDRDPALVIPVKTYRHYSECEPWLLEHVGEWNIAWWRDFPDMAMATIVEGPHEDCYWFANDRDAMMFRLKF
jgi:hypothetical protein